VSAKPCAIRPSGTPVNCDNPAALKQLLRGNEGRVEALHMPGCHRHARPFGSANNGFGFQQRHRKGFLDQNRLARRNHRLGKGCVSGRTGGNHHRIRPVQRRREIGRRVTPGLRGQGGRAFGVRIENPMELGPRQGCERAGVVATHHARAEDRDRERGEAHAATARFTAARIRSCVGASK
jgi:hypothetical protein